MKQTSLFLLFFPLLLWSCKDEEQCPAKDYVEATFQLTGEWAEDYPQFEEFMDYIGIEVLHADGTPYAYGLFDYITDPKIKLCPNGQYIIRAMLVPDGRERIPVSLNGCLGITDIFWLNKINSEGKRQCSNVEENFIYDNEVHFWQLECPLYTYPYKIYAGHTPLYTPSSEHIITLDMKRMFSTILLSYDEEAIAEVDAIFYYLNHFEENEIFYINRKEEQKIDCSLIWETKNNWLPDNCFLNDELRISMTNKPYDIVYSLKLERGKIQKIDVEL